MAKKKKLLSELDDGDDNDDDDVSISLSRLSGGFSYVLNLHAVQDDGENDSQAGTDVEQDDYDEEEGEDDDYGNNYFDNGEGDEGGDDGGGGDDGMFYMALLPFSVLMCCFLGKLLIIRGNVLSARETSLLCYIYWGSCTDYLRRDLYDFYHENPMLWLRGISNLDVRP